MERLSPEKQKLLEQRKRVFTRRKKMNRTRRGPSSAAAMLVAALALTIFGGCRTQQKKPEPVSAATVETQADGIHFKTRQAEFVLTTSGGLLGRLKSGTQWLTLDEASPSS